MLVMNAEHKMSEAPRRYLPTEQRLAGETLAQCAHRALETHTVFSADKLYPQAHFEVSYSAADNTEKHTYLFLAYNSDCQQRSYSNLMLNAPCQHDFVTTDEFATFAPVDFIDKRIPFRETLALLLAPKPRPAKHKRTDPDLECADDYSEYSIEKCLEMLHNSVYAGHTQPKELFNKSRYTFPKKNITLSQCANFVDSCSTCQHLRFHAPSMGQHPGRPTSSNVPFDNWFFDHLYIGPDKNGYNYVLAFIDAMSRYAVLFPTKTTNAKEASHCLLRLSCAFGIPPALSTDQGSGFTGKLIEEFVKIFENDLRLALPGRPQAIALVERSHQETLKHLRALIHDHHSLDTFSDWLFLVEREINNHINESTGMRPVDIVFAQQVDLDRGWKNVVGQQHLVKYMRSVLDNHQEILEKNKAYVNRRQQNDARGMTNVHSTFPVNSLVLVAHKNDKRPSKMHSRLAGPYRVVRQAPLSSAITIRDIVKRREHTIHVSRVAYFNPSRTQNLLEIAAFDMNLFTIDEIKGFRRRSVEVRHNNTNTELCIKWNSGDESYHPMQSLWTEPKVIEYIKTIPELAAAFKQVLKRPREPVPFVRNQKQIDKGQQPMPQPAQVSAVLNSTSLTIEGTARPAEDPDATEIDVVILIDSGANKVNTISGSIAIQLLASGAIVHESNLSITGHVGPAISSSKCMFVTLILRFNKQDLALSDSFVIVEDSHHQVILGDSASAKANLLSSPVDELQILLDRLAKHSTATVQTEVEPRQEQQQKQHLLSQQQQGPEYASISRIILRYHNKLMPMPGYETDQDSGDADIPYASSFPADVILPENSRSSQPDFQTACTVKYSPQQLFDMTDTELIRLHSSLKEKFQEDVKFKIGSHLTQHNLLVVLCYLSLWQVEHKIFSRELGEGLKGVPDMQIRIKQGHENDVFFSSIRPTSEAVDLVMHENIVKMLAAGVIEYAEQPRFTSCPHMVKHPDKPMRFTLGIYS